MMKQREPLETRTWFREINLLKNACADASGAYAEQAIRQAFNLGKLSPKPIRQLIKFGATEEQLEEMLERGEWSEAIRAVVSNGKLVTTSLSTDGQHHIHFAWADKTVEVEAKSPILALLVAWLTVLGGGDNARAFIEKWEFQSPQEAAE